VTVTEPQQEERRLGSSVSVQKQNPGFVQENSQANHSDIDSDMQFQELSAQLINIQRSKRQIQKHNMKTYTSDAGWKELDDKQKNIALMLTLVGRSTEHVFEAEARELYYNYFSLIDSGKHLAVKEQIIDFVRCLDPDIDPSLEWVQDLQQIADAFQGPENEMTKFVQNLATVQIKSILLAHFPELHVERSGYDLRKTLVQNILEDTTKVWTLKGKEGPLSDDTLVCSSEDGVLFLVYRSKQEFETEEEKSHEKSTSPKPKRMLTEVIDEIRIKVTEDAGRIVEACLGLYDSVYQMQLLVDQLITENEFFESKEVVEERVCVLKEQLQELFESKARTDKLKIFVESLSKAETRDALRRFSQTMKGNAAAIRSKLLNWILKEKTKVWALVEKEGLLSKETLICKSSKKQRCLVWTTKQELKDFNSSTEMAPLQKGIGHVPPHKRK